VEDSVGFTPALKAGAFSSYFRKNASDINAQSYHAAPYRFWYEDTLASRETLPAGEYRSNEHAVCPGAIATVPLGGGSSLATSFTFSPSVSAA